MSGNLRSYMNKNNITNSSRMSNDQPRMNQPQQKMALGSHGPKFTKSKQECAQELSGILDVLNRKQNDLQRIAQDHNSLVYKKFSQDYDRLAQQIIKHVQNYLRENKQRLARQIRDKRSVDMAQTRPIKRNIQKLKQQISGLRNGLYREGQYRQYISKIVLKDYEMELNNIQTDIDRVRFPNVDLRIDDKYYRCFKSDLEKLIVVRDQMAGRYPSNQNNMGGGGYDINPHENRDMIKRDAQKRYT